MCECVCACAKKWQWVFTEEIREDKACGTLRSESWTTWAHSSFTSQYMTGDICYSFDMIICCLTSYILFYAWNVQFPLYYKVGDIHKDFSFHLLLFLPLIPYRYPKFCWWLFLLSSNWKQSLYLMVWIGWVGKKLITWELFFLYIKMPGILEWRDNIGICNTGHAR